MRKSNFGSLGLILLLMLLYLGVSGLIAGVSYLISAEAFSTALSQPDVYIEQTEADALMARSALWGLLVFPVILLIAYGAYWLVQRTYVVPIGSISAQLAGLDLTTNRGARVHSRSTDNQYIRQLSGQVNGFLDELEMAGNLADTHATRLMQALDMLESSVFQVDIDGVCEYVNAPALALLELSREQVVGCLIDEICVFADDYEQRQIVHPAVRCLATGEPQAVKNDTSLVLPSGRRKNVTVSASPVFDITGLLAGCFVHVDDVSETRQLKQQLVSRIQYDHLTGLPNREAFLNRLEDIVSHGSQRSPVALLLVDVDHFNIINDRAGRAAGDELLNQLGALLYVNVEMSDEVARVGADEFGVLLVRDSARSVESVAKRLLVSVSSFQFKWEGQNYPVGLSIGFVAYDPALSSSSMFAGAEAALQVAKRQGGNRYHAYSMEDTFLSEHSDSLRLYTQISYGLEKGTFELYFQGIFAADAPDAFGHIEILLRLKDENGQFIAADRFVPVAEDYGLAERIDQWVITTTFKFFAEHRDRLKRMNMIAINLSGASINNSGLADFIQQQLEARNLPGEKFCFEFTETAAIAKLSSARMLASALRNLGCKFALDDFGTGMSSFAYLKNFDIDYLKIDGSFVKNLAQDYTDLAIVRAFNDIGRTLGLRTIAEFVETEETLRALEAVGVDYLQGFYLHKPSPINTLLDN